MGLYCRAWDAVSELPKASAVCTCDPGEVGVVWAATRVAIGVHPCPAAVLRGAFPGMFVQEAKKRSRFLLV